MMEEWAPFFSQNQFGYVPNCSSGHPRHMSLLIQFCQLGLQLRQNFRNSFFSFEYGFVKAAHVGRGEAVCDGADDDVCTVLFVVIDGLPEYGEGLAKDVIDACCFAILRAV